MKNKGFTFLEMIAVVMVIAIITVLAIPNISKVMNSVDDKACEALRKVVDSALVEFKMEYGVYPSDIRDLISAGYLEENQISCSNGKELEIEDGHTVSK